MKKLSLEELNRVSVDEFKKQEKHNFCFALDNIRSRNNVGTFFRTGDALNIKQLILGGITSVPPHRDIQKTAIGATESVDWVHTENLKETLLELKKQGWKIVSIEQVENSMSLTDFAPTKTDKYIFIFGNEVDGVDQELIDISDITLEIPQFGTKHSFNVSVSAGIIGWHYLFKAYQ